MQAQRDKTGQIKKIESKKFKPCNTCQRQHKSSRIKKYYQSNIVNVGIMQWTNNYKKSSKI